MGYALHPGVAYWCLKWLLTSAQKNSGLTRWALKLQEYTFKLRHRKGTQNGNTDAMSCQPVACAMEELQ